MPRTKPKRQREIMPIGNALNNQARNKPKEKQTRSLLRYLVPIGALSVFSAFCLFSEYISGFPYGSHKKEKAKATTIVSESFNPKIKFNQTLVNPKIKEEFVTTYNSPEVVSAKKAGFLEGLLYNPSDETLEKILRHSFAKQGYDDELMKKVVESGMKDYHDISTDADYACATIVPRLICAIGEKLPMYVVIREKTFSGGPGIRNDNDFRSLVRHEIKHCIDWYYGIHVGDQHVTFKTMSPETFRIDFLKYIMEVRAVYEELKEVYDEKQRTGRMLLSNDWFESRCSNYAQYWRLANNYEKTPFESAVLSAQSVESRGITAKEIEDKLQIHFRFNGNHDVVELKIKE